MSENELRAWCESVPKVELHLHLEGAIPYCTLLELIAKYGGNVANAEQLKKRLQYRDFAHFIETWLWKNTFIRELEDFTHIAGAVAADLAAQNVRYAEVFFSPRDFRETGLRAIEITDAISRGFDNSPLEVKLIVDVIRDMGPVAAMATLEEVADHPRVVGVGMGGSEQSYPPGPFAAVYERASQLNLGKTVHAGEAAGAESVAEAIIALGPARIGHGTRAAEDPHVMDLLLDRGIGVELCPLSNVATGVIATVEDHPIERFLDRGIPVCLNTDDPKMFHNSLAQEYEAMQRVHGISRPSLCKMIESAVEMSFLSDEKKGALLSAIRSDPVWYS